MTGFDIAEQIGQAYNRAASVQKVVSGFKSTGISPYDPDVFAENDFAAASVTEIVDNENINKDAALQDNTGCAYNKVNCNQTSAALDKQTVDIDNEDRNVPAERHSENCNPQYVRMYQAAVFTALLQAGTCL